MYAFCDYFHREKFPNIPVSLVSELHNYSTRSASSNRVAIPSFRTYIRKFCPSHYRKFFWNDIPQFIRDKPSRKMFRKALLRWYLAQYKWELISFIIYWAILSFFLNFFLNFFRSQVLCYTWLSRGTISVYLDVPFSSLPIFNLTQSNCCNFCFLRSLFPFSLYIIICYCSTFFSLFT